METNLTYLYPADLPEESPLYRNTAPLGTPDPKETAWLLDRYRATKVADSCPLNHIQSLVVGADLALGMNLTDEAPVVLALVTGAPAMIAQRGEGSLCQPA